MHRCGLIQVLLKTKAGKHRWGPSSRQAPAGGVPWFKCLSPFKKRQKADAGTACWEQRPEGRASKRVIVAGAEPKHSGRAPARPSRPAVRRKHVRGKRMRGRRPPPVYLCETRTCARPVSRFVRPSGSPVHAGAHARARACATRRRAWPGPTASWGRPWGALQIGCLSDSNKRRRQIRRRRGRLGTLGAAT